MTVYFILVFRQFGRNVHLHYFLMKLKLICLLILGTIGSALARAQVMMQVQALTLAQPTNLAIGMSRMNIHTTTFGLNTSLLCRRVTSPFTSR